MRKNEKGSVTLFVLIACIFIVLILVMINIGIMNKNINSEKEIDKIISEYNKNESSINEIYRETVEKTQY